MAKVVKIWGCKARYTKGYTGMEYILGSAAVKETDKQIQVVDTGNSGLFLSKQLFRKEVYGFHRPEFGPSVGYTKREAVEIEMKHVAWKIQIESNQLRQSEEKLAQLEELLQQIQVEEEE